MWTFTPQTLSPARTRSPHAQPARAARARNPRHDAHAQAAGAPRPGQGSTDRPRPQWPRDPQFLAQFSRAKNPKTPKTPRNTPKPPKHPKTASRSCAPRPPPPTPTSPTLAPLRPRPLETTAHKHTHHRPWPKCTPAPQAPAARSSCPYCGCSSAPAACCEQCSGSGAALGTDERAYDLNQRAAEVANNPPPPPPPHTHTHTVARCSS